jgi:uncharacterized protein YodC (DUF2158 family)
MSFSTGEDVDFKHGGITVAQSKTGEARKIPVNSVLTEAP